MQATDIQDAIKRSIQTEKNAMNFYQLAASHMTNAAAKKLFELLAREEREHAEQFFSIYEGTDLPSFDDFIRQPALTDSSWMSDLLKNIDNNFTERKAMELALDKEQKLEAKLNEMAAKITDAAVRAIYEKNIKSTHNHYVLIESEYARLMGMVHETDIDTFVRE